MHNSEPNLERKDSIKLGIWIALFQVIGIGLGLITKVNLAPWYALLQKSSLTPPGWVFSIVWPILYLLLALVAHKLWENYKKYNQKRYFVLFAIQQVLNWAWTPLFFHFHLIGLSFVLIALLCLLNAALIVLLISKDKIILLLVPYLAWLLFATYLNGFIWYFNA